MQLEFTMIDPYWRVTLQHDNKGEYSTEFMVPDVYGVYKFGLHYRSQGYSNLDILEVVAVRPFRSDEFERFIPQAYPYYISSFSVMAAFAVFGVVFLYSDDK